MTINTTNTAAALETSGKLIPVTGGLVLAGVLLWIPAKRRRRFTLMLFLLIAFGSIFATGCGGSSKSTGPSGAGTYTFTVTGKDVATGTIVSSTTVTATVQ